MKYSLAILVIFASLAAALPVTAGTTASPKLTISRAGKIIKTVALFDKWTDGATLAVGDLGTDGVPEVLIGAGPGSLPKIKLLRQDGSTINEFLAFDQQIADGVVVGIMDADGDGQNDIVAATGPKFGKYVRVFNGYGTLLHDWYPIPEGFNKTLTAAAIDDNELDFSVPAPRFTNGKPDSGKQIEISLSKQRLYAYENGYLVATYLISSGTSRYPTKTGEYKVLRKQEIKRYIGPGYDLPNTHWNTQFSTIGYYMHEAYWHENFGQPMSHGCINMRKDDAKFIYDWSEIGTPVIVTQ